MRVKLTGSLDLLREVETALNVTPDAGVEQPSERRESGELQFGLKEVGDLVGVVKDLADLAPILIAAAGIVWRKLSSQTAPAPKSPAPLTIDVTTAMKQVRITIRPGATVEDVTLQIG